MKIIKNWFSIGEGYRGDSKSKSILKIIGVFEVMIFDVVNQGFESVAVSLCGAISGFERTREGVIFAETEVTVETDDFV